MTQGKPSSIEVSIKKFKSRRRTALMAIEEYSWDEARPVIIDWMKESHVPIPESDAVLKLAIHYMRLNNPGFSEGSRQLSRDWIDTRFKGP